MATSYQEPPAWNSTASPLGFRLTAMAIVKATPKR